MRALTLAKAAAAAEKIRLQAVAQRQVRRGVYGFAGAVFGLGALTLAHGVAWLALRPVVGSMWSGVSLLAFDLVVAGVCLILAVWSKPGEIEVEAQRLKELAIEHLKDEVTLPAVFPALAALVKRKRRPKPPSEASRGNLRRLPWPRRLSG